MSLTIDEPNDCDGVVDLLGDWRLEPLDEGSLLVALDGALPAVRP